MKDGRTSRSGEPPGLPLRELIRAGLDGELDEAGRRRLGALLAAQPEAAADYHSMRGVVSRLRLDTAGDTTGGIDMTGAVLERVDRERRFLPAAAQRRVWVMRGGAVAAALACVAGVGLAARENPDLFRLTKTPRPVTSVLEESSVEASASWDRLTAEVTGVCDPVVRMARDVAALGGKTPTPAEHAWREECAVLMAGPLEVSSDGLTLHWTTGIDLSSWSAGSGLVLADVGGEPEAALPGESPAVFLLAMDTRLVDPVGGGRGVKAGENLGPPWLLLEPPAGTEYDAKAATGAR